MRQHNRLHHVLRDILITRHYLPNAEGSVLIEFGNTKVICTASVQFSVPPFLKGKDEGWVTAEYGMLPRSTHDRMLREAAKGKQTGRTQEIQRLIGRALRQAVDTKAMGECTITIDCDVISADGGTRTAAITGGCIALYEATRWLMRKKDLKADPFKQWIAAISVGICGGETCLDLDYQEDSKAETDMNVVMTESGGFIEIQGTAEHGAFSQAELDKLLQLASEGIRELINLQKEAVSV